MTKKLQNVTLVALGLLVGCGAAAVAPMAVSQAQGSSYWNCYQPRFGPEPERASTQEARNTAYLLNKVANHAAPGTLLTPSYGGLVCVRY